MLLTFFDWKTSKWAYHLLQFFISYWETLLKLIKFITQSYLWLLNLLLFLTIFSAILNNYFFRWLAYKSLLSRLLMLINYIMWSYNLFSVSNDFHGPGFYGSRFLRGCVQGLELRFGSSLTLVCIFSYIKEEKMWK